MDRTTFNEKRRVLRIYYRAAAALQRRISWKAEIPLCPAFTEDGQRFAGMLDIEVDKAYLRRLPADVLAWTTVRSRAGLHIHRHKPRLP